jgi:hypothetical protein
MTQTAAALRNRRLSRRKLPKGGLKVLCQKGSWGLGPNLALAVLDVSEAGIRLVLKAPLEHGQEISVTLSTPGRCRPLHALARTVWSVETADGAYCVGASFERRLSYADVIGLAALSRT